MPRELDINRMRIYRTLAKKYGITMAEVDLAVSSQFSLVRKVIKAGNFEQIRLPFFGRFWVKAARKKYLDSLPKKKYLRKRGTST
ncbi:hypothetical protein LCGC14_1591830 [marine sediment metagenome]|uniref:Uncharacterized protein n=1 Tax=marine sediment metagenome TaxID=412755 RepID=A0A0F9LE73_9ZZZZ